MNPILHTVQKGLLSIYSGVNRTGLLETPPARALFRAAYFTYKRFLEDPFWKLSQNHPEIFGEGDFCDVGANVGYTVRCFAPLLAPQARLFAFEPEARNFSQLRGEVDHCKQKSQITAIHAAVGNREGTLSLWVNPDHHADHRILEGDLPQNLEKRGATVTAQTVPVVTLDVELLERQKRTTVSFIKIDVQGFELPVFQGMQQILDRNSEQICVAWEYAPDMIREAGFQPKELLDFWKGWKMYGIQTDGNLLPLETPEALETFLGAKGYGDLLTTRRTL